MRCHQYLGKRTTEHLTLPPIFSNPEPQQTLQGVDALLVAAELSTPKLEPRPMVCYSRRSPAPARRHRSSLQHMETRTPRPPRPVYTREQDVSLLFFRDLIGLSWRKVEKALNKLYDEHGRRVWPARSESGLQSRYYRLVKVSAKEKKKMKREGRFVSVLDMYGDRYWWMYCTSYQEFEALLRLCGEDINHPRMEQALEERQAFLRRGVRRSEADSDDDDDDMMSVISDTGAESAVSACPTLTPSLSPRERSQTFSPSPEEYLDSAELFHYKVTPAPEADDDNRSLIDHSMEGLDDGSRRHSFRAVSSKL